MSQIDEILSASAKLTEPSFVSASKVKIGGVDPLGLRQTNFDMMDQVLPGINNVAVHIRPFVVVTWAWRRAKQCAEKQGIRNISADTLRDFVDRIEVIFAWSQFLRDPDVELPGRDVLRPLINSESWTFGGKAWRKQRETRRDSTAFMAAINYGPMLKTLGWLEPYERDTSILIPTDEALPALDAFEVKIKSFLDHSAFNEFGEVLVSANDVSLWSDSWAIDDITDPEKEVMAAALFGSRAPIARRNGGKLIQAVVTFTGTKKPAQVRKNMAGHPTNFVPTLELAKTFEDWRAIQMRQLFRLSLEALLYWISLEISSYPMESEKLVSEFLSQIGTPRDKVLSEWFNEWSISNSGPTDLMDGIEKALFDNANFDLAISIVDGLVLAIRETSGESQQLERSDRLPLSHAKKDFERFENRAVSEFLRHVIESWVLAQHVYWSIGRGLGDARSRGKQILRLKVILEEDGWTLAPGVSSGSVPRPTADRLRTVLSLASECNLLLVN